MKKVILGTSTLVFLCQCFADPGTVTFANSPITRINTNATAVGGGIGLTAPDLGGFLYGLFTAPYGTANADLITGPWTFTGLYATNIFLPGRLNGGTVVVPTWPGGQTNDFKIAGWSSNLGLAWEQVEPQLATGNWNDYSGFFGESAIGFGVAGEGGTFLPPFVLFGTAPNGQGDPVPGFDLFSVVPEPAGGLLLLVGGLFCFLCNNRRRLARPGV